MKQELGIHTKKIHKPSKYIPFELAFQQQYLMIVDIFEVS